MHHLNEGQGVRCSSAAVTHTLQTQRHPWIYCRTTVSHRGPEKWDSLKSQSVWTVSHLLEQSHGELLVRYAVFGGTDVLPALCADVEVDTHQEILLRNMWHGQSLRFWAACGACAHAWRVCSLLSVGTLVNLTVGAASIFHKRPTDSLTEHIYYQSIRQHLSGAHIKHEHRDTHGVGLKYKHRGKHSDWWLGMKRKSCKHNRTSRF